MIWMSASKFMRLNDTKITARGGDAQLIEEGRSGSGGGSGGAIQISTPTFIGSGLIDVSGGLGSDNGGGGAGGAIHS